MKTLFSTLVVICIGLASASGQELKKDLAPFEKIIASPKINVVLTHGDRESIRLVYENVSAADLNVIQNGKTLHVFLTNARYVEKRKRIYENNQPRKVNIYRHAQVTAYITYRDLKRLEIRGEQEVSTDTLMAGDKFKLKAYGEANIYLAGLHTNKFKSALYGRNVLKIHSGTTESQKFRLYGENRINTRPFNSINTSSRIYGEGKLVISASHQFRYSAFGEPHIEVNGFPEIRRGLIIGRTRLEVKP